MNKIHDSIPVLLGLLVLATLTGCSVSEPVPTHTPTPVSPTQPTETDTPVPTPQPIETDTPTPLPTATLQLTATPSPFPEPQPYPTPEWTPYADAPFTIVFERDGHLWLSEVGGQGERLLTTQSAWANFAVSPDGQAVAYNTSDDEDNDLLMIVNVLDGGTRVVGSANKPDRISHFLWSPMWWGNAHVAYYTFLPPSAPKTTDPQDVCKLTNLVVVDLATGESVVEPAITFQYPSPDGRYMLSGHNCKALYPQYFPYRLSERETGEEWAVTDESIPARFLGWSPDGRLLLFSLLLVERREAEPLLVVDVETRMQRVITPEDKVAGGAVWSPDSQTIAHYQCNPPRDACVDRELWLTSSNGSNRHRVPMEESLRFEQISWTPDSSRLVFGLDSMTPSIWSVRVDGTDLRPIAEGQNPQVLPAP